MAVTVEAFGTQTATVTTEHSLHTNTDPKVYQLMVDTSEMVLGDELELRAKVAASSGGTKRQVLLGSYRNVQADPIKISVPVISPYDVEFTLKQTAGAAGRDFDWVVTSI